MPTLFLLLIGMFMAPLAWGLTNQLKDNPSPYLALHSQDPVAWQEWNAQAFELARAQNKLLFVSIGYFSCHWCHVMQRESYRDARIAAVLNEDFIPVKVDRELMTALDSEMQAFSARTQNRSGWPINVFITPEGYPLFSTMYSPPDQFLQIVQRLDVRWKKESSALSAMARNATAPQPKQTEPGEGEAKFAPALGAHYRAKLVSEALEQADLFRGGFGGANKFPMSPQLAALLEAYEQDPQPKLGEFLKLTLDQMASQGLYDHVGGGFFRYTTDPDWRVPHFEKMLSDNAQLAILYLRAADVFKTPRYREIAYSGLEFMLTTLHDSGTRGFMASTSAIDDQNREGGVYLWEKDDLKKILSPDELTLVARIWGMDKPSEFTSGFLPLHQVEANAGERIILAKAYSKLRKARNFLSVPKDQKRLTSTNGLALMALSEAARTEPRYTKDAKEVRDFLAKEMWQGDSLFKGKSKGLPVGAGELEDYAYASAAMLSYGKLTGAEEDLDIARKMARQAWKRFHGKTGWRLQQSSLLANPTFAAVVEDGAVPSPASLLIRTSWGLKDKLLRTNALAALNTGYSEMDQSVFWFATQVAAMNSLQQMQ